MKKIACILAASRNSGGGLADLLVSAVVSQAVNDTADHAHEVSVIASQELFMTEGQGLLNGPYKPASAK